MSFKSGNVATFSLDGTDISAFVETVQPTQKRDDYKLPRIGGNSVARLAGPVSSEIQLTGWFDPSVDAIFAAAMAEADPTTKVAVWEPQGAGGPSRTGNVFVTDYAPDTDGSKPGSWKATLTIDGDWS
jgi:hypothetical protein